MIDNLLIYANYMFSILMPFTHIGGYLSCSFGVILIWSFYKKIEKEPLFLLISVFIVYGLILSIFSGQPSTGFSTMLGYFSHWFMPFVLGFSLLNPKYFKKIFWTFIIVFGSITFFSVLAYFHLFFPKIGKDFYLVNEGLLKGLRSHIALGALCLLSSFLVLTQALLRKEISAGKRLNLFMLFLFFVFALFLTGSRTYYISAVISYLCFGIFWVVRTRNWRLLASGAAVLAVILCAYFFAPVVKERIQRTTSQDSNIQERVSLYKVAISEIKTRPFFGYGPGQGIKQLEFFEMLPADMKNVSRHPALHSFYLNFAADFGIIGFLIFVGILYFIFCGLDKSFYCGDDFLVSVGAGLLWGLVGILIGEMFDTLLRGPGVAMEVFWLTGLVFRQLKEKGCESAAQQ